MNAPMSLIIAGQNRTSDLGRELIEEAHRHPCPELQARIDREPLLTHPGALDPAIPFPRAHLDLLHHRQTVDLNQFRTPGAPGLRGRLLHRLRQLLWTVFRYQHEWSTFKQNSINTQLTYALEFEQAERQREVQALNKRIDQLEQQLRDATKSEPE